jgi:hypothetical protein
MANPDFVRGLQPWGPLLRARIYSVVEAVAVGMYHGDMVETVHTGIASKYGNYTSVVSEETGALSTIVGAVLALFNENMDPVLYIATSEPGDGIVAGYALVADHPEQEFVVQEDGVGGVTGVANAGQNGDLINTSAGSTGTGLSGMELDSNTVNTTSTLALQLLNPVPDQDDTLAHCDWIVRINAHFTGNNILGI